MPTALDILSERVRSANQQTQFEDTPGKEPIDYLKDIGGYGLGAIGAVGNALDIPGSMVRDVISSIQTGKWVNPFDQLLTPFTDENRTSGRKILEQAGFRKNRDSTLADWVKDPYEGALDIGGFMVEVLADPTAPMKWALGGMTGLDRLITRGVKGTASISYGITRGMLKKVPVVGEPFSDLVDKGQALAGQLFVVRRAGISNPKYREIGERFYDETMAPLDELRAQGQAVLTKASDLGMKLESSDPQFRMYDDAIKKYFNGVEDDGYRQLIPDELVPALDELRQSMVNTRALLSATGGVTPDLVDVSTYWQRFLGEELKELIEDSKTGGWMRNSVQRFTTNSGVLAMREQIFKGNKKGTAGVDQMFTDPRLQQTVEDVAAYFDTVLDEGSRIGQATDHLGPEHLKSVAKTLDMTPREMWERMGFTMGKPYAKSQDVISALQRVRGELNTAAERGEGKLYAGKTGMKKVKLPDGTERFEEGQTWLMTDLSTGKKIRVNVGLDGNPLPGSLPNGQSQWSKIDPTQEGFEVAAEYVRAHLAKASLKEASGGKWKEHAAAAMSRFDNAITATPVGGGVYAFADKDGVSSFYRRELRSNIEDGWKSNLKALVDDAKKRPVTEKQAQVDAVEAFIEREYGDMIRKDMPHFNSQGKIVFDVLGADGKPMREGNKIKAFAVSPKTVLNATIKTRNLDGKWITKDVPLQDKTGEFIQENIDSFFNSRVRRIPGAVGVAPRLDNRYKGLAYFAALSADARQAGIFGNNAVVDFLLGMKSMRHRIAVNNAIKDLAVKALEEKAAAGTLGAIQRVPLHEGALGKGSTFKKLLDAEAGIDSDVMRDLVRQDMQLFGSVQLNSFWGKLDSPEAIAQFNEYLDNVVLDQQTYQELRDFAAYYRQPPEMSMLGGAVEGLTAITKSNLLATPRTVARDAMSGAFMGYVMGDLKISPLGIKRFKDALSLASGRGASADLSGYADIVNKAEQWGLDPKNPADLERTFVSLFAAKANQQAATFAQTNSDELAKVASGRADALLNSRPMGMWESLKRIYGDNVVQQGEKGSTLWNLINPMNVPGARKWNADQKVWEINSRSNLWVGFHSLVRGTMDNTIRMAGVLNRMDEGMPFDKAWALVNKNQINYDPRTFTRFEKTYMKKWFLFYSFMSRSLPLVAGELITRPGGRLGQVIRAQRVSQGGQDSYVPYDLMDTAAIPWGQTAEGDLRYVSNLGLMHEDAMKFLAPTEGIRGLSQKIIGSLNPAAKMIIEYGTNTSTFFDGPMGGRRLDDLDPLLGRILVNMGIRELPPSGRPDPVGGRFIEALAANSPLSAALQYIRTGSDTRRGRWEKALNLFTGIRTRMMTPEMMSRELRDRLNAEQIALGARPLTTVIGTSGLAERYRLAGETETAEKLRTIEAGLRAIRKQLDKRNKAEGK